MGGWVNREQLGEGELSDHQGTDHQGGGGGKNHLQLADVVLYAHGRRRRRAQAQVHHHTLRGRESLVCIFLL